MADWKSNPRDAKDGTLPVVCEGNFPDHMPMWMQIELALAEGWAYQTYWLDDESEGAFEVLASNWRLADVYETETNGDLIIMWVPRGTEDAKLPCGMDYDEDGWSAVQPEAIWQEVLSSGLAPAPYRVFNSHGLCNVSYTPAEVVSFLWGRDVTKYTVFVRDQAHPTTPDLAALRTSLENWRLE